MSGSRDHQHRENDDGRRDPFLAAPKVEGIGIAHPDATTRTPSNADDGGGGGEGRHPLLCLHQSVVGRGSNGKNGSHEMIATTTTTTTLGGGGGEGKSSRRQPPHRDDAGGSRRERRDDATAPVVVAVVPDPSTGTTNSRGGKSGANARGGDGRDAPRPVAASSGAAVALSILLLLLWLMFLLRLASTMNSVTDDVGRAYPIAALSAARSGALSLLARWGPGMGRRLHGTLSRLMPPSLAWRGSRLPMEQLERRLALGFDLLRRNDDASGSSAACEFVVRAILDGAGGGGKSSYDEIGGRRDGDLASIVSSSTSLDADEAGLLSRALLCVGEANLASSLSSHGPRFLSTRAGALIRARESLEAATAVDPTVPAVRCGLGLTYLLFGVTKYDDDNDDDVSLQYVFQSIQHLKAAVGMIDAAVSENEGTNDEAIIAVRNAAMHNLGLAYISLDGKSSSSDGARTTHFMDWARSLPAASKSWVLASNMGAMLLQLGMIEEATLSLESIASEFCGDSLSSSRQKEVCSIVHRNLAVARAALNGEKEGQSSHTRSEDTTAVKDAVSQLNKGASSTPSADIPIPSEDDDVSETADETSEMLSLADGGKTESNHVVSNESNREEAIDPILPQWGSNAVKPEMRKALAALEKAATEGTQRTRLLLALARARASTGDFSGAVDASLKAIGAATSGEEMESSTAYLESLMEKMAGESSEDIMHIIHKENAPEMSDEASTNKDFSLLEMKLELERLKYKVLEQEIRLGCQQNSPNPGDDVMRVIGYQKQESTIANDASRRVLGEIKKNSVTGQIVTKFVDHVQDAIHEVSTVAADEQIQEASTIVADDRGPVVPESSTSDSNLGRESTANVTLSNKSLMETDAAADAESNAQAGVQPSTKSNAELNAESNEENDAQPLTENDAKVDAESNDEADVESHAEFVVDLPGLFSPVLNSPAAIPPTAKSYMKMADAYLDKGQYALASKQFLKVIKKAPDHLPAYLGYATALERAGKGRQIHAAALAYGNATKLAIIQGNKVDPMAKAGTGGIAENILRRAVGLTKSGESSGRLETLLQLVAYAHTNALAADIYFEIGLEMSKQGIDRGRVAQAFTIANEYIAMRNDAQVPFHIRSIIELCKNMLLEDNVTGVIHLFKKVHVMHMEDDVHTELLVLVGRAHAKLGDLDTAISEFTRALAFPLCSSTALAHHKLASTLKKSHGDEHEINLHYENALDKGMEPTPEAIEALGERNIHVMRALNRQYYSSVNGGGSAGRSGGGIMSGGGVGSQSSSIFAPKATQQEDTIAQSDTLTLLEQGAASYDGHSPMGGEVEGTQSSLSNLKAKKQQGSESNLQKLKR